MAKEAIFIMGAIAASVAVAGLAAANSKKPNAKTRQPALSHASMCLSD